MNIAVFGVGYVGLVTALGFAEMGHRVVAIDSNAEKMRKLNSGESPIHERHVPELLQSNLGMNLRFTSDVQDAVRSSEAVFLCVGTPPAGNGRADLSAIFQAVRLIAPHILRRILIVVKSTVPVGTCDRIREMLSADGVEERRAGVACNPEFLREGSAIHDFVRPDRIVLGADNPFARDTLRSVYEPLFSRNVLSTLFADPRSRPPVLEMSTRSAELLKHASNAFLALKISYINGIANIAEETGANIDEIAVGMGADPRIGSEFLQAGIGYGGSCFPKDIQELRRVSEGAGYCFDLLGEVQRINTTQRSRLLEKLEREIGSVRCREIAVLGLSFKAGTDDLRCSPAIAILDLLLEKGARVSVYDPVAMENARQHFGNSVTFFADAYECVSEAEAVLILTDWPEFASLDLLKLRDLMVRPVVVDGRNLYCPAEMAAAGLVYISVGRQRVAGDSVAGGASSIEASDLFLSRPRGSWRSVETLSRESLQTSDKSDIEV